MKDLREHVELIADYILDVEREDFFNNPSKDHVYYSAYLVLCGENRANQLLTEALRDLKEGA